MHSVPYGSYRVREFYENGERCYRCRDIMGEKAFEEERERQLAEERSAAERPHAALEEEHERVLHTLMEGDDDDGNHCLFDDSLL